jgi:hypothetical protein
MNDPILTNKKATRLIEDKYTIMKLIAEGGFGSVYLATDIQSADEVAIKVHPTFPEPVTSLVNTQRRTRCRSPQPTEQRDRYPEPSRPPQHRQA